MIVRSGQIVCAVVAAGLMGGCTRIPKPAPKPASPVTYTTASDGLPTGAIWKSQMTFGDVNGDGFPDIGVISRLHDGPYIFIGDGQGHWRDASAGLPRETFCGGGMAFADINNDGKMDVAIADHCKGVYVFAGDGTGNWKAASSGLPTIGSEDVAVGDFNKDGCVDLVMVAAAEEGVRAFKGDCKGTWRESSEGLPHNEWGNAVAVGDVDGDGNLDVAAAYSAGPRVWLGDGKGGFRDGSEGLPAPDVHGLYMFGIALGDVNGDGKMDLAATSAFPGVEVFLWDNGKWVAANNGLIPLNALGVTFGDLNNDGKQDLVVAGKSNLEEIGGVYGVFTFLGDGTGNWTQLTDSGLPLTGRERTWGAGVADINNDGVLDIGVAFGDVLAPTYRTGGKVQMKDASKKDAKNDGKDAATKGPERGRFGSIEVWLGHLTQP